MEATGSRPNVGAPQGTCIPALLYHEDFEEEEEIHDEPRRQRTGTGSSSNTVSSSRSGTIVSTASTTTTSGSRLSSGSLSMSTETAMHFDFDLDGEKKEQIMQITSLVQEFSISGNMSVLERWFEELGVTWVLLLHLGDGAAPAAHAFDKASSWIQALAKITETISLMVKPKTISLMLSVALPSIGEEAEPETASGKEEATSVPDRSRLGLAQFIHRTVMKVVGLVLVDKTQATTSKNSDNKASIQFRYQFAQFIRETMPKMLAFVDVAFALAEITREDLVGGGSAWVYYKQRLNALLGVRDALSSALIKILISFNEQLSTDEKLERIQDEILGLMKAAESKANEAILTRLEQARTGFLKLLTEDEHGDNSWQGSSVIHKVSRHVMGYVTFIQDHYKALHTVVSKAALDSLLMEMVSRLQENLASKSELFPDHSLRFLFLINNLYFILGNFTSELSILAYPFDSIDVATIDKPGCIELVRTLRLLSGYLESYIQVSWEPLLACRSQLSKFEPKFQKIYTTQKQWKVPDPKMRAVLREEITRKIIPGHPKYVMDNKATTPKVSPWWDMEHMMQQLFEG